MAYELVLDIGNSHLKGGIFEKSTLLETFAIPCQPFSVQALQAQLKDNTFNAILLSSVNTAIEPQVKTLFEGGSSPFYMLNPKDLTLTLDVDEPEALGHDRIANAYGALFHFPSQDCIIVDVGTAVTFDVVTKEGWYKGGAIYPGIELSAKALANYTDKLPLVTVEKPPSALARTTETHIQSGIYFGLLGAIERIIFELKSAFESPSSLQVLATGGATKIDATSACAAKVAFTNDLKELVDFIDPHLTLVGLHEILKEYLLN